MSISTLGWTFAALALATGPAMSQPIGNPKGTLAPATQGNAAKPPASAVPAPQGERPADGSTATQDSRAARSGNLRTPGIGTAGGLTGRHPGDGSSTGATETNQSPRVKR